MPRYLGLNYWHQIVIQRREFFSQSLLTVPHHLELTETYVHKDYKGDYSSWKSVLSEHYQETVDDDTTTLERTCLKEINVLCNIDEDEILEKFESDAVSKQIGGVFEVIPNSNPESLFSSDSDEVDLLRACDFTTEKRFEVFEEENLDNYQNGFEKDCLEDVFTSDNFSIIRDKIPHHDLLLKRLHSKSLQDPLADANGQVDTEKTIFGDSLKFSTTSENQFGADLCTLIGFEVFEKHMDNNKEENELEEILTPFQHETSNELSRSFFIKDTDENYLKSMPLLESSEDVQDELFSERKHNIESGSFSPIVINTRTFVELNNDPKDELDLSKGFMESPLLSPALAVQLENKTEDFLQRFQALQPLVKSFSPTDKVIFLRQFEMKTLTNKVWQHEKYFDEILALRLQEPDTEGGTVCLNTEFLAIRDVKQQLQLVSQTGLGELELQLSWDIFQIIKDLMVSASKLENLDYTVREKHTKGVSSFIEEFHKFDSDQFYAVSPQVQMLGFMKQTETGSENRPKSEKVREDTNTAAILGVSSDQVCMDPLQNFLSMRNISIISKSKPAIDTVCNKPSKSPQCIVKPITPMTCQPSTEEHKSQHRVMEIKLAEPFEKVYCSLRNCAEPYISVLKDRGEISREQDFDSLDPDSTKFLLKQREKSVLDLHEDSSSDDTYRTLLIVHALCGAADLLVHCCLKSAISYLSAMQEKHRTVLGGSLQDVRQKLFLHQCSFHQKSILHPKIASVCKEVEIILNTDSKLPENVVQVLIVLKRPLQTLMLSLKNALSTNSDITPVILESSDDFSTESIQGHNCVLASVTHITKCVSLDSFTLVIEYEYQVGSSLENTCATQNIDFIGYHVHDAASKTSSDTRVSTKDFKPEILIQVTVVGSHLITHEKVLLQILESRHNIAVFERDYENLLLDKKLYFADIVIDEKHGVVIHLLKDFTEDWQVEQLTRRLVSLSLQLSFCWVILYSFQTEGYIFSSGVISNVWKLQAALANISNKSDQFQCTFKILLSSSQDDMACLVRSCCNHCIDVSSVWKEDNWSRKWMKEETSPEECFLLGFPCLNSFSAQLLLSRASLGQLLSADFRTLSTIAPELPNKTITLFQKLVRCDSGLKLRTGSPKSEDNSFPGDNNKKELGYCTGAMIRKPEAREIIHYAEMPSQQYGFPKDHSNIEEKCEKDIDKKILKVKAVPSRYDITDIPQEETYFSNTECKVVLGSKHKLYDLQTDTSDTEDGMSLPCMKQCEHPSQEFHDSTNLYNSQEYHKPNQYVLAEMEAKNLQIKTKQFHRDLDSDLDFENTIVVHSQGRSSQPVHGNTRPGDLLESMPHVNHLINPRETESKPTAKECIYSSDEFFNNRMQFQSKEKGNFNSVELTESDSPISIKHATILEEYQTCLPETHSRRKGFKMPMLDKRPFDFEIPSRSKEFKKQDDFNIVPDGLSSQSLPSYIRKAQKISESFWSEEFRKSRQPPLTRLKEDSYCMTSLPRRPVLKHHFANSLIRPPLQRISVGLAQPLRRTRNVETESTQSADSQHNQTERWTTGPDSPPMDFEPEPQSPKLHTYNTAKNKDEEYLMPITSQWQKCAAVKDSHTSWYGRNDIVNEDFASSKKKKLTYKPLPGKQSGQTILTFR
ncbi:uncharacterized protein LOC121375169 isoform X2 [Gigantopelta aegis]|uniref:uncharacterized protein LOC121375169 isoform X2 n=1 Tax=Gigantopelta aegis TaxID=1735272 RepID=UPI001B889087|nr:uncharacterized protein LOC121375169 isoform X2 [Gigantopelta aegis]